MMKRDKRRTIVTACVTVATLVLTGACDRDARLAGRNLRQVSVHTVTHYGLTLDKTATPEQVVYVLLRAIRDDFLAKSPDEREKALDKQFDVCAAGFLAGGRATRIDRRETIFRIVYHWTPTVAHYVDDIETEWEQARDRFKLYGPEPVKGRQGNIQQCHVVTQLADPGGDPNAHVLLSVRLVQDEGYWRVMRLGYISSARALKPRTAAARTPTRTSDG